MMDYQKLPPDPNAVPPALLEALARLLQKPSIDAPPQNWQPATPYGQPVPTAPATQPDPTLANPTDDPSFDYQKLR